jgi:hypothetical protein
MDGFREGLASDSVATLQFFVSGLRDVTAGEHLDPPLLFYNASVLAHFASTSTQSTTGMPAPMSLMAVFDHFVLDASLRADPEMMEMAGAQCLLLTGFFADQVRARYNIEWYGALGAEFYRLAAATKLEAPHKKMMSRMSEGFQSWRGRHLKLSRELRVMRHLMG